MPVDYTRDDAARCVTLVFRGAVQYAEWRAAIDRQISEGCWTYGLLVDAAQRTREFTASEQLQIVDDVTVMRARHGPRGPVAYVTTSPVGAGRSGAFRALTRPLGFPMEVFPDLASAQQWIARQLGVSPE